MSLLNEHVALPRLVMPRHPCLGMAISKIVKQYVYSAASTVTSGAVYTHERARRSEGMGFSPVRGRQDLRGLNKGALRALPTHTACLWSTNLFLVGSALVPQQFPAANVKAMIR